MGINNIVFDFERIGNLWLEDEMTVEIVEFWVCDNCNFIHLYANDPAPICGNCKRKFTLAKFTRVEEAPAGEWRNDNQYADEAVSCDH